MNPETPEKQKNRPFNRKILLRGLAIGVFLMILPFAGIQAWKQFRFLFNKSLWEQNYQSDYIVYFVDGSSVIHGIFSDDELWQNVERCLKNFACEVHYNQENYLPVSIHFENNNDLYIQRLIDCRAIPARDELLSTIQNDCRIKGFEPITSNE